MKIYRRESMYPGLCQALVTLTPTAFKLTTDGRTAYETKQGRHVPALRFAIIAGGWPTGNAPLHAFSRCLSQQVRFHRGGGAFILW